MKTMKGKNTTNGWLHTMLLSLFTTIILTSCSDDSNRIPTAVDNGISMGTISIKLTGVDSSLEGMEIQMRNTMTDNSFIKKTDAEGKAVFTLAPGIYEASSSTKRETPDSTFIYNGSIGQIVVNRGDNGTVELKLVTSKKGKGGGVIIIKELYNGGCPKDDGSSFFQSDKSITLYNNSDKEATIAHLCIGFLSPYNSHGDNKWYDNDNRLAYENEDFVPALDGIWYFPDTVAMAPYSRLVVNCQGAIDNTKTYSQSVNYADKDYYCMYDPEKGYNNSSYYPTPADVISQSHYLKAVKLGISNAWALSVFSPAVILFQTKDVKPETYATNVANHIYTPGAAQNDINKNLKVPRKWIIDGIEVYTTTATNNQKRLTADIDAGYVSLTNKLGHTLYRNVDKKATEALPENNGKLVYGYSLGVGNSTDPSGIDAEASIKKGAHIIYMDTNNSSADFHERQKCALRD